MDQAKRASFDLSINWKSKLAQHQDRLHVSKVDFWRDIFPAGMEAEIPTLSPGESVERNFDSGELVPTFEQRGIITFKENLFETEQGYLKVKPSVGRFYPQGFAARALNSYKGNFIPFRLIDKTDGKLVADINHPLASYPIKFAARYVEELAPIEEHGGACNDIAELVTQSGPGMQAPSLHGKETDFFSVYPFKRNNECDDELFYKEPRLIYHLDTAALKQVSAIYARLLQPGSKILDLMSSHVSHIPQSLDSYQAIGLGMNEKELSSNPQLSSYKVQNLNRVPILPFENNQFDAVICTASIEYLMRPIEVVKEVARVTRNGGLFITTFSDRWFPGKEIQPWSEMHPFERMGLVSEYYRKSGWFDHLNTESIRGLPRPLDDPHINQRNSSDPVFAIWGQVVK